jgi:hypothetical protein
VDTVSVLVFLALRAKAGGAPKEVLDVNDDDELLIIVMVMIAYATKATMVILL